MTDKKFNAILAKNSIARDIKVLKKWHDQYKNIEAVQNCPLNTGYIESCLKDIEIYLGEGNQPSVKDIIECKEFDL